MKLNSDQLKAAIASYWRYHRNCSLVALEANYGDVDILVVTNKRLILDVEVKVSLADLRADAKKFKHKMYSRKCLRVPAVNYFYFAVPKDIGIRASLICDDLFPYAGVIGTDCAPTGAGLIGHDINFYRKARLVIDKETRASVADLVKIAKQQSGTVCRLAGKLATQKNRPLKPRKP